MRDRSCVINHFRSILDGKDNRLAYIYFDYKDAETQLVPNLLLSLVCQLASAESPLPDELIACYEAHDSGASNPSQQESTQMLRFLVNRCAKVFLIIDALDECSEDSRDLLWMELHHVQSSMNMLITSRDLPNVENRLVNAVRLGIQPKNDEIVRYARERITNSERLQSYVRRDSGLCESITETVAARAEGL